MPSNNIVSINDELYNCLNDVNYRMSKPQLNHLTIIVNMLINLPSIKTLSEIAKGVLPSKDKSCIYRFLSHPKWADSLLNANRISHLNSLTSKTLVCFIYEKSKQNIPLEDILEELKNSLKILQKYITKVI